MVVGCEAMLQHRETSCRTENGQHKFQTGMMIFVTAIKKKKNNKPKPNALRTFQRMTEVLQVYKAPQGRSPSLPAAGRQNLWSQWGDWGCPSPTGRSPDPFGDERSGAGSGSQYSKLQNSQPASFLFSRDNFWLFFFSPTFFFFPSLSLLAAGCQRILCLTSRCFPLGWAWSYSRVTWGWQAAWPGRLVPTSPPVSSSRCSPGKQKKTPSPASASQRVLLGSGRKG